MVIISEPRWKKLSFPCPFLAGASKNPYYIVKVGTGINTDGSIGLGNIVDNLYHNYYNK